MIGLKEGPPNLFDRSLERAGRWLAEVPEVKNLPLDAVAFLDPIDQICAEPPPRYARTVLYAITGLVLSLVLIGGLVQVDKLVTANGRLVTSAPPILLQPIERAIIREINVHAGDVVHKGDVLATLDPTFSRAELGTLAAQNANYQAQQERLAAELADRPFVLGAHPTDDEKLQATLFEQRQAYYHSHLKVFSEDIERIKATIASVEKDGQFLDSQLNVAKDVEEMRLSLMKSQNGSRLNFLEAQSTRMRLERDYQNSLSQILELRHSVQSKLAEQQAFIDDWRRQILEQQSEIATHLTTLGGSISKATLINNFVVVTAPVDGVVLDVAQRSVGSIMHEAEPFITINPAGSKLVAEVGVASGDVGSIKAGDAALMKVDAFPYAKHGMLKGHIAFISEETMTSNSLSGSSSPSQSSSMQAGGEFHRAEIEIDDATLAKMPKGARLLPGMTLRAEVKVGSRSVLNFFLGPMTQGISEALSEN